MFTIDKKQYDEKKLEGEAKIAFTNCRLLVKNKDNLLLLLERNNILSKHYSGVLKKNLPNGKDKK